MELVIAIDMGKSLYLQWFAGHGLLGLGHLRFSELSKKSGED
jgi:hypothetical protein